MTFLGICTVMLDVTNLLNFFCLVALFDVKILFLIRNNYLSWAGPTRLFKNKITLRNNFLATNWIPIDLTSGVVYKFQCGFCNESYYSKCVRHLNVRIGEHIGISPLTKKQVKPKNSSVADHLILHRHYCNYSTGPSNKIFVRILFAFNSCYVILTKWTFYYFVKCKRMDTTVRVNGTVQFTFFLVMRLDITVVTSCDSLIAILAP